MATKRTTATKAPATRSGDGELIVKHGGINFGYFDTYFDVWDNDGDIMVNFTAYINGVKYGIYNATLNEYGG